MSISSDSADNQRQMNAKSYQLRIKKLVKKNKKMKQILESQQNKSEAVDDKGELQAFQK